MRSGEIASIINFRIFVLDSLLTAEPFVLHPLWLTPLGTFAWSISEIRSSTSNVGDPCLFFILKFPMWKYKNVKIIMRLLQIGYSGTYEW